MTDLSLWQKIGHRIFIFLVVAIILLPFYWLGVMSVTPQRYIAGSYNPAMFPVEPSFEAFSELLTPQETITGRAGPVQMFRYSIRNSIVVSVASVILGLVLGSLSAYALRRLKFPGRALVFLLIIGSRMIARITLAIPLYSVFRTLGILDTYAPLVILYTSLSMSWATLIMFNYFGMIPKDLEEAARVDGCTRLGALWRVVLPLSTPGLVAVATVTFLFCWGEFLFALLYTTSASARTLPVVVSMFVGEYAVNYRMIAGSLLIAVIPPVIVALLFQRFIVQGLTAGSVKG